MDGLKLALDDPFVVKTAPFSGGVASPATNVAPPPVLASLDVKIGDVENSDNVSEAASKSRSPEDFLGINSSLVNLDSLVSLKKSSDPRVGNGGGGGEGVLAVGSNPFALTPSGVGIKSAPTPQNPFAAAAPKGPPMNLLMNNANNIGLGVGGGGGGAFSSMSQPLVSMMRSNNANGGFQPSSLQRFTYLAHQQQEPIQRQLHQQANEDPNPFLL